MSRLADDPEKRKGLQLIFLGLIICLVAVVVIGIAMHFLEQNKEQNADPMQSLSAPAEVH